MLFPLLLFLLYFGVGVFFVLILWAIQIRFGDVSDLDPQSFMVRLLGRKIPCAGDSGTNAKVLDSHPLSVLVSKSRLSDPPFTKRAFEEVHGELLKILDLQLQDPAVERAAYLKDAVERLTGRHEERGCQKEGGKAAEFEERELAHERFVH